MKRFDRVIGIYDSAEMKLNTAITFFVPVGMSTNEAYAKVKKTEEFDKLNRQCGGDETIHGDVGMAIWKLPMMIEVKDPEGVRHLV